MRWPSQCVRQVADYKHIFMEKSQTFYGDHRIEWTLDLAETLRA